MVLYQIVGWLGAILYTLAYLLLSIRILSSEKLTFHILNVAGGICLIVNAVYLNDTPNFFVNALWAIIGIYSIGRITGILTKNHSSATTKTKCLTDQ